MTEHAETPEGDAGGDGALWLNVSDLAERLGLNKSSVSQRLVGFVDAGLVSVRPGKGKEKLVNVGEYEHAVATTGDVARMLATKRDDVEGDSLSASYTREQAREKSYKAELARLDLEERLGALLPVDQVVASAQRIAGVMVQAIEQVPSRAEDCAAAVLKDGAQGARAFLRGLARGLREQFTRELDQLVAIGKAEHASVED